MYVLNCRKLAAVAMLGASTVGVSSAAGVLYWSDAISNPSGNALSTAINQLGMVRTMAFSGGDFRVKLAQGGWDCVVLLIQANPDNVAADAMAAYVTGGGRGIYTDYTRYAPAAAAFGATYTGGFNSRVITHGGVAYFNGAADPFNVVNVAWVTDSNDLGVTGSGVGIGTYANSSFASVLGNSGRSILNGWLNDTYDGPNGADHMRVARQQLMQVCAVPEPASMVALAAGAIVLIRRRRNSAM